MYFLVLHAYAAIWKHRGPLTAWDSPIQHCQELLELPEAIRDPKEVAVIHGKGPQKGNSDIIKGNNLAKSVVLVKPLLLGLPCSPRYQPATRFRHLSTQSRKYSGLELGDIKKALMDGGLRKNNTTAQSITVEIF